jgi:hypothetical protein
MYMASDALAQVAAPLTADPGNSSIIGSSVGTSVSISHGRGQLYKAKDGSMLSMYPKQPFDFDISEISSRESGRAQKQINISHNRRIIHQGIQRKQFQCVGSGNKIRCQNIDRQRQGTGWRSGNGINTR